MTILRKKKKVKPIKSESMELSVHAVLNWIVFKTKRSILQVCHKISVLFCLEIYEVD